MKLRQILTSCISLIEMLSFRLMSSTCYICNCSSFSFEISASYIFMLSQLPLILIEVQINFGQSQFIPR